MKKYLVLILMMLMVGTASAAVIKSGDSGEVASVNSNKQLNVQSEISPEDHNVNERDGKVWSLSFENIDPTSGDDYFFYIKNTGTAPLEITDFRIASTVAGQIEIKKVSGTAAGGTDLTAISRNTSKAVTPSATIQTGADITGLSDDGTFFFMQLDTVNKQYHLSTSSRIILGPGTAAAILWEVSTGILTGTISIIED